MKAQPAELIDFAEITEIELRVLRRLKEYSLGDHQSVFQGPGVDFVGLRDWQAGDRLSSIDWPQSTLTNFTPLVVREFEQPGTAPIIVVADRSASTSCGMGGTPIAAGIARAIATIGLSAVYFQDQLGLITFEQGFERMASVRPRVGRAHVIHCLDAFQRGTGLLDLRPADRLETSITGHLRTTALVPVISDFMFDGVSSMMRELKAVNSTHDVFIVIIDSAFAFEIPDVSAGWLETYDVETGKTRVISRQELKVLGASVRAWQDDVAHQAQEANLDVLRMGVNQDESLPGLFEFVTARRLRK